MSSEQFNMYRQTSNISRTLVGNKIVDHSDVVGASPIGAAPTTPSFSTWHMASMYWVETTPRWDENHLSFGIWCSLHYRFYGKSCEVYCLYWVLLPLMSIPSRPPRHQQVSPHWISRWTQITWNGSRNNHTKPTRGVLVTEALVLPHILDPRPPQLLLPRQPWIGQSAVA